MGKSVQDNKQGQKQQQIQQQKQKQNINQQKKKIIKKFPFKKAQITNNQDGLKDWKPVKIEKVNQRTETQAIKQQNIAQSFLNSLPKPVNKAPQKKSILFDDDQPIKLPRPLKNITKPTPQQIKWDIQDQTFIKKQFLPKNNVQHVLQQDQVEQNEPIEQIIIKGRQKQKNPVKMKHIDLSKMINKEWKQKQQSKMKNQLWEGAQGLLDGHGSLSKLAKQAQEKKHQIQQQLNKRSYEDRKTKSRYGW